MKSVLFASTNTGKIREVSAIFETHGIKILNLVGIENLPEIIEDEITFEGNAVKKAKEYYKIFRVPILSDDSGLEVEQLNGEPGVFSARYAGEPCNDDNNNKKLIKELEKFKRPHNAMYVCLAVYFDGRNLITSRGECKGEIIDEPRGSGGFGYDPYFVPTGFNKTMAEISLEEKNKISHRKKAFSDLYEKIKYLL